MFVYQEETKVYWRLWAKQVKKWSHQIGEVTSRNLLKSSYLYKNKAVEHNHLNLSLVPGRCLRLNENKIGILFNPIQFFFQIFLTISSFTFIGYRKQLPIMNFASQHFGFFFLSLMYSTLFCNSVIGISQCSWTSCIRWRQMW